MRSLTEEDSPDLEKTEQTAQRLGSLTRSEQNDLNQKSDSRIIDQCRDYKDDIHHKEYNV